MASCSQDSTIKLFNINGNEYNVIQTLTYHNDYVSKIIELKNKKLVSCSGDKKIIFYFKENNEYTQNYNIQTNGGNGHILQIKDNEICYHDYNSILCFFDLLERKNIAKINDISFANTIYESLIMLTKDLLLATRSKNLTIININSYSIVRKIDVSGSDYIYSACLLNNNIVLTSDSNKKIIQWKIEGDNLRLISKKENAHNNDIFVLQKIGNGLILSGDSSGEEKIW